MADNTNRRDIVRNTYDKIAGKYAVARRKFDSLPYLEKLRAALPEGADVLDLGCGSGVPVAKFLVDAGCRVRGVDLSEKQIELAKRNVPEGTFELRDISGIGVGEYAVDAVVSFYAIFHVPRETHADLFAKMRSFLRPKGMLLVTMAATDWEGIDANFLGEPMFESHYGPKKNAQMIRDAGFKILLDEIDLTGNEKHQIIMAETC
jgi:cyclopropane fatty-acyl-phospholipid synthase-like methyltransferase